MDKEWDRSKQNYFILRRGRPWTVRRNDETWGKQEGIVCDYPAYYYDNEFMEKICFAKNDDEVRQLVDSIPEFTEEEKRLRNLTLRRYKPAGIPRLGKE